MACNRADSNWCQNVVTGETVPDLHDRRDRNQKLVVDLWHQFLAGVSWVLLHPIGEYSWCWIKFSFSRVLRVHFLSLVSFRCRSCCRVPAGTNWIFTTIRVRLIYVKSCLQTFPIQTEKCSEVAASIDNRFSQDTSDFDSFIVLLSHFVQFVVFLFHRLRL